MKISIRFIAAITSIIFLGCAGLAPMQKDMSPSAMRIVSKKEGAIGTAFIFKSRDNNLLLLTAAHTAANAKDDLYLELRQQTPASVKMGLEKVIQHLQAKKIVLPARITNDPEYLLSLEPAMLKKMVCDRKCELSSKYLLAGMDGKDTKSINLIMLQETFPEWFGPNPHVQIKDIEVISNKHDIAVVITENSALFQGFSPFLYATQARIGAEVGTYHFPTFPPLKLGQLYSEGVISGKSNEHDWLVTITGINNGSSGAPLFFKNDPQQLAGMVLAKISSNNGGASTGLVNVLCGDVIAELIENHLASQRKVYHD